MGDAKGFLPYLQLPPPPQNLISHPGCWGRARSPHTRVLIPLMTPGPRYSLWFIGAGDRFPPHPLQHRTPRCQGLISSLTKAAMQYWRATGDPPLQYLRAARALLTALQPHASPHSLQSPRIHPPNQRGLGKGWTWSNIALEALLHPGWTQRAQEEQSPSCTATPQTGVPAHPRAPELRAMGTRQPPPLW